MFIGEYTHTVDPKKRLSVPSKFRQELGKRIAPTGLLFANNAILEDDVHPEHYDIDHKEFVRVCMDAGLMPVNTITYLKDKVGNRNEVAAVLGHAQA